MVPIGPGPITIKETEHRKAGKINNNKGTYIIPVTKIMAKVCPNKSQSALKQG